MQTGKVLSFKIKEMRDKVTKNKAKSPVVSMPIINPFAAGIDVSATMHAVAVPADKASPCVREFGAFTEDLEAIASWLCECGITTVAMESTGVYWKQLYLVLLQHGLSVSLVNARHVKNVTGRKTDMDDAQWIQKLHSCGLLNSCFLPDEATERVRNLVRHRKCLLEDGSKYVLRMQKAMELMNIKLHSVISDLMGKTGRAIIEAILAGQRNAEGFLPYIHPTIKADRATILKSLTGNWREEHLFLLRENYELYKFLEKRIVVCEQEIERFLQMQVAIASTDGVIAKVPSSIKGKKKHKNEPEFDVHQYLYKIFQVDVTAIYGISRSSALEILSETGPDLSKWETEKHFVSWLNLCPNNKITGGKLISSTVMKKQPGNATQAFRAAANSVQKSDHWLGDYFRRMKTKGGNKYAIIATARKLATIYYKMVRYKLEFKPLNTADYREQYKTARIAYLEKQLNKLKAVG
jgi:transposase